MRYSYNDGLYSAGRRPRLYLAKGGEVVKFQGENVFGWTAIVAARYEKNGKWSNTSYVLDLANGVRPLYFLSPMHQAWGDDYESWGGVAEALGLPVDVAQRVLREEYPATASRLDQLEAFALQLEEKGEEAEVVVVSFGSPTNRQIAAGYWGEPKKGMTADGREVVVKPGAGSAGGDWYNPEIVAPTGAKVLEASHKPGMHGGYWTIKVAVPSGAAAPVPAAHAPAPVEGAGYSLGICMPR